MSVSTYTSKRLPYNLTTLNYITAVVMVLFHVGAGAILVVTMVVVTLYLIEL